MIAVSTTRRMPTTDFSRHRTRVIIIEDNQDAAEMLRLLLDLKGYDVRVAHTGPEGVRLARFRQSVFASFGPVKGCKFAKPAWHYKSVSTKLDSPALYCSSCTVGGTATPTL